MTLDYLIRPKARDDIDDAYFWYETQNAGRGDTFFIELRNVIATICQTPDLYGRVRGEVRAAPLPDSQFIVYYRIEPQRVSILAVLHAAADPRKWKLRK